MISQKTVQDILDTVKVEEVIQDFVNLRRRGANMIGLCPFHHEKTPSFSVSPAKNIYKCFGCGRAGNAVQFVMEHEHFTFPEALRYLAKKYGIEIEETLPSPEVEEERQHNESLFIVNQFAQQFFQEQLLHTNAGKSIGMSYFKERGFLEETIQKFGLGFAPDQYDALTKAAMQAGYQIDFLRQLGLTTQHDRDFFRNRVMFTIHNLSGKPIAFAGRIMAKDAKAPKYINSPETEIYFKSKVLYGAYFAKQAIRREDECILVEGYTDVISLHQAGIENVVASSGTSLTEDQIRLIKRYTPNVKVLFDGDSAGIKAALRGIDMLLKQDLNVKVVLLPEREDPDSYLKLVGSTAFQTYLGQNAKDFILFKADLLLSDIGNDPIKKTQLLKEIIASIALIPDPLKRAVYMKECARMFEVEEQLLVNEANKLLTKNFSTQQNQPPPPVTGGEINYASNVAPENTSTRLNATQATTGDEFQEKDLVRILVNFGHQEFDAEDKISVAEYILHNIEDIMEEFDHPMYKRMVKECLVLVSDHRAVSTDYFLHHEDENMRQAAINLVTSPYELSENWAKRWEIFLAQKMPDDNFVKDSERVLKEFRYRKILRLREKTQRKIEEYQKASDFDQAVVQLKVKMKLDAIVKEIARELGVVVAR